MSKLVPANVVLCYDGSLEGFFSVVFNAYATHRIPSDICAAGLLQPAFGQEIESIETDLSHAERVRIGLATHGGARLYDKVKTAFLSDCAGRERAIFSYIVLAMELGYRIHDKLDTPEVAAVEKLVTEVLAERERVYQFLRFEQLEGGIFFARISPKANVVPIVMPHFVERFGVQPFLIYDEAHGISGVYDGTRSTLVKSDELDIPAASGEEQDYELLWKRFYDAVSCEQRYNPKLRTSFTPQRLWRNITEFKLAV